MPEFNAPFYDPHKYGPHKGESACSPLESLVRAAGGYVQPTEDLRPRALEAAHAACRKHQASRRLGGLALMVLLAAVTGLPNFLLSIYPGLATAGSAELHHRAAQRVAEKDVETHWALYEAFYDLRREHAALLGPKD